MKNGLKIALSTESIPNQFVLFMEASLGGVVWESTITVTSFIFSRHYSYAHIPFSVSVIVC